MGKAKLGAAPLLIPMPVVLVGADVGGRANFITIAYCGIVSAKPPMIAVGIRKVRYSGAGIKENGTFSVCIPSEDLVERTDYCGMVSGAKADKSSVFSVFYGELKTAPMIEECPLCMECRLDRVIDLGGTHEAYIGEIVELYADEECVFENKPRLERIRPFVFSIDDVYWKIGGRLADAFSAGERYGK